MQPNDSLGSARVLLAANHGAPTDTCVRRAISACYYAMFHLVCRNCAELLIGPEATATAEAARQQVYRSLDHRQAKNRCSHKSLTNFPGPIIEFARSFTLMQDKRHEADYNPNAQFTLFSVRTDLEVVAKAIAAFETAPEADRRAFCAFLLFPLREDQQKPK